LWAPHRREALRHGPRWDNLWSLARILCVPLAFHLNAMWRALGAVITDACPFDCTVQLRGVLLPNLLDCRYFVGDIQLPCALT
jgi:hypothetical protein